MSVCVCICMPVCRSDPTSEEFRKPTNMFRPLINDNLFEWCTVRRVWVCERGRRRAGLAHKPPEPPAHTHFGRESFGCSEWSCKLWAKLQRCNFCNFDSCNGNQKGKVSCNIMCYVLLWESKVSCKTFIKYLHHKVSCNATSVATLITVVRACVPL